MKAKLVRMLLIVWPCVACLWLAALPPIFAQESKPPAKTPDLQGTWNLVSCEKNGKDQKRANARFSITDWYIHADGVPGPGDHDFGLWHYDLGPSDKPNVGIVNLVGSQGRVVVPGLCELDGATLRIVLGRITPTRAQPIAQVDVDRPTEFATKPGTDQLLFVLKRAAAADDPISLLRKLAGDHTITVWGGVKLDSDQAKNDDLALTSSVFPRWSRISRSTGSRWKSARSAINCCATSATCACIRQTVICAAACPAC